VRVRVHVFGFIYTFIRRLVQDLIVTEKPSVRHGVTLNAS